MLLIVVVKFKGLPICGGKKINYYTKISHCMHGCLVINCPTDSIVIYYNFYIALREYSLIIILLC